MKNNKDLQQEIKRLKKELNKVRRLSIVDDLTGLYNSRKLHCDLKRCLIKQQKLNIKYTIIMLDINNFKYINDTYGHLVGDKRLKEVAVALCRSVRYLDKVYRLYGDEFVIKLTNCNNINKVFNRINKNLKKINVVVSFGYNKLNKNVIKIIDKKMYEMKKRNR